MLTGILGFVIIFGLIVFFHELGHFAVAKWSGMTVHDFALGFGPALVKWTRGGTTYAIRAFPLGGYVRIAGMEPPVEGEEAENPDDPNSYEKKPFIAKFGTMVAGVAMNFVLAFLLWLMLGMAIGYPMPGKDILVTGIDPTGPAAKAGMKVGDQIVQVNDVTDLNTETMRDAIRNSEGSVRLVALRDGAQQTYEVVPVELKTAERKGLIYQVSTYRGIGISFGALSQQWQTLGPVEAVKVGALNVADRTMDAVAQIVTLVTGRLPVSELGGPVAIARVSYDATKDVFHSRMALANAFGFAAFLSIMIGFFNLLPFPALDGSRALVLVVEKLRGKPFDRGKEAMVHLVGLVILLSLIIVITFKDIYMWVTTR